MNKAFQKIGIIVDRAALSFFALLVIGAIIFVVLLSRTGQENYIFQEQWQEGFNEADKIFLAKNLCTSRQAWREYSGKKVSCASKNTIEVLGIDGGFSIYIYGIQDQDLIQQISQVFIKEFVKTPRMNHLVITAYAFSKQEELDKSVKRWQEKALVIMDIRRNK